MELTAIEFKSKCLEIMDRVEHYQEEALIIRNGVPVIKLVPCDLYKIRKPGSLFGYMKDSVKINGDIISPIDENWEVDE